MCESRQFPTEMLRNFIELYKSYPCLWKVKSPEYSNKILKQQAYQKLVDLIRPMFPNANKDFVTRKINAIRGYFRRELKKVLASKKSAERGYGEIYEPSLWYFDLLLFTKDQEIEPVKSHDSDSTQSSSSKIQSDKTTRNIYKNVPVTRRKRKRSFNTYMQKFTEICENALQTRSELSEYAAIGVNVAKKLEKMDPRQAMYAESIIHKVLKKGLSKELSPETIVYDSN